MLDIVLILWGEIIASFLGGKGLRYMRLAKFIFKFGEQSYF